MFSFRKMSAKNMCTFIWFIVELMFSKAFSLFLHYMFVCTSFIVYITAYIVMAMASFGAALSGTVWMAYVFVKK